MSATGRGGERDDNDFYPTPVWAIKRALERIKLPGGIWLEPCAGDGRIIQVVRELRGDVSWAAVEKRPEALPFLEKLDFDKNSIRDFLTMRRRELPEVDVTFSNPPYNLAQEFIEQALDVSKHVVYLLRLNFLGSEDRAAFLQVNAPDVYVLPNRPSFSTSLSCKNKKKTGCDWKMLLRPELDSAELFPKCPKCGAGVSTTRADATEYAWFHFFKGGRRSGKLEVLDPTPIAERAAIAA
jgi:hypothetical protein